MLWAVSWHTIKFLHPRTCGLKKIKTVAFIELLIAIGNVTGTVTTTDAEKAYESFSHRLFSFFINRCKIKCPSSNEEHNDYGCNVNLPLNKPSLSQSST